MRAGRRAALLSGSGCRGTMLSELGFIGTIGEDEDVPVEPETDSEDEEEEVRADRGGSVAAGSRCP